MDAGSREEGWLWPGKGKQLRVLSGPLAEPQKHCKMTYLNLDISLTFFLDFLFTSFLKLQLL